MSSLSLDELKRCITAMEALEVLIQRTLEG